MVCIELPLFYEIKSIKFWLNSFFINLSLNLFSYSFHKQRNEEKFFFLVNVNNKKNCKQTFSRIGNIHILLEKLKTFNFMKIYLKRAKMFKSINIYNKTAYR